MTSKNISYQAVHLCGNFWGEWQKTDFEITAHSLYQRFEETGRINAMTLGWKVGQPNKPHFFWDSDVAKWMEGVAYVLYYKEDTLLKAKLEHVIDLIETAQTDDGYFNSYFLTFEPENRFTDRTAHELYTAGHLIEASVAYYEATGETRFLKCMTKFADLIEEVFCKSKRIGYKSPGHQELELALIRLWHATGDKRYLNLSRHFVEIRGTDKIDQVFNVINGTPPANPVAKCHLQYNSTYAQDNAPVHNLKEAAGHAVRAMYLYAAMADIALEFNDDSLFNACKSLWIDSTIHKMYVTGGVSGERFGEAIGEAYALPNETSYAETCASIAMAQFAQRMFLLDTNSCYADNVELQMYNGALVGLSLDGEKFFYDNALEARNSVNKFLKGIHIVGATAPNQRVNVFDCSCCPPNIFRFIASLGSYFYSIKEDIIYIQQYSQGKANFNVNDNNVEIEQETQYPYNGAISINIKGNISKKEKIAVRIPSWCKNPYVLINEEIQLKSDITMNGAYYENGYLYMTVDLTDNCCVSLDFPMPIEEIEAHPLLTYTCGKVALKRGPIVYCVESADNNVNLFDLTLPKQNKYTTSEVTICNQMLVQIKGTCLIRDNSVWNKTLYQSFSPVYKESSFYAIPYFSWANRELGDMLVWLQKQI